MYNWNGMKKISWKQVKRLHKKGLLTGCFLLYPDNTESEIGSDYKWEQIVKHHDNNGEIGYELSAVGRN